MKKEKTIMERNLLADAIEFILNDLQDMPLIIAIDPGKSGAISSGYLNIL